jgi:hypothetical protein
MVKYKGNSGDFGHTLLIEEFSLRPGECESPDSRVGLCNGTIPWNLDDRKISQKPNLKAVFTEEA